MTAPYRCPLCFATLQEKGAVLNCPDHGDFTPAFLDDKARVAERVAELRAKREAKIKETRFWLSGTLRDGGREIGSPAGALVGRDPLLEHADKRDVFEGGREAFLQFIHEAQPGDFCKLMPEHVTVFRVREEWWPE